MLAKIWKKVLLAICIVACIFNIMNKLVGRTSLENNLKNVKGESIFSILNEKETSQEENAAIGDQTFEENNITENLQTTTSNTVVENEVQRNTTSDYVVIY